MVLVHIIVLLLDLVGSASPCVTFVATSSLPNNASPQLVSAPVGVSLEFFTFPAYFNDVASTFQCLQNLRDVTGTWPPIRIGGTTQDRATYDSSQADAVEYSVSNPADAPSSLTFGPSFAALANTYGGQVTLGLNRRLNNQQNTIEAAQNALSSMSNLESIELGNEPNFYSSSDPIAGGSWSASKDFASQVSWQSDISSALGESNIFSAGVYFGAGSFNIQGLSSQEGTSLSTVKDFCSHNYPQSASTANLAALMSHSAIHSQIAPFKAEAAAASQHGKPYIFGETNSATQGGGGISPTFGAGLWILDYVMQSLLIGVQSFYFHQGTIGNCQYCWWGRYSMGAPYYGAYFISLALSSAKYIAPLDDASGPYAAYAIYTPTPSSSCSSSSNDTVLSRILFYNSVYYTSGPRPSQLFTVKTNLPPGRTVTGIRLTAPFATSRQDYGQNPTVAGQSFQNGTCLLVGSRNEEHVTVDASGGISIPVMASEAVLLYL